MVYSHLSMQMRARHRNPCDDTPRYTLEAAWARDGTSGFAEKFGPIGSRCLSAASGSSRARALDATASDALAYAGVTARPSSSLASSVGPPPRLRHCEHTHSFWHAKHAHGTSGLTCSAETPYFSQQLLQYPAHAGKSGDACAVSEARAGAAPRTGLAAARLSCAVAPRTLCTRGRVAQNHALLCVAVVAELDVSLGHGCGVCAERTTRGTGTPLRQNEKFPGWSAPAGAVYREGGDGARRRRDYAMDPRTERREAAGGSKADWRRARWGGGPDVVFGGPDQLARPGPQSVVSASINHHQPPRACTFELNAPTRLTTVELHEAHGKTRG